MLKVRVTVLEPGSSWEIKATPGEDGTHVDATFIREYKRRPRARLAEIAFRVAGKWLAGSDLRRAPAKIEQRAQQRTV